MFKQISLAVVFVVSLFSQSQILCAFGIPEYAQEDKKWVLETLLPKVKLLLDKATLENTNEKQIAAAESGIEDLLRTELIPYLYAKVYEIASIEKIIEEVGQKSLRDRSLDPLYRETYIQGKQRQGVLIAQFNFILKKLESNKLATWNSSLSPIENLKNMGLSVSAGAELKPELDASKMIKYIVSVKKDFRKKLTEDSNGSFLTFYKKITADLKDYLPKKKR